MEEHSYIELTADKYEVEVGQFEGVVFLDFWATWWPPCRMTTPFVEQLAEKYKDNRNVKVAKVNADEAP